MIAKTFPVPYYAVIFTSLKTQTQEDYATTNDRMMELAVQQPGFLGIESAHDEIGITVSYWQSPEAISNWKNNFEHLIAQQKGKEKWYESYTVRVCKVERDYGFEK